MQIVRTGPRPCEGWGGAVAGTEVAEGGESLLDRATAFATIRNREGHVCVCEETGDGVHILEYHHPLAAIFEKHPATLRMERNLVEQALSCVTKYQEEEFSGLKRTRIQLYPR